MAQKHKLTTECIALFDTLEKLPAGSFDNIRSGTQTEILGTACDENIMQAKVCL